MGKYTEIKVDDYSIQELECRCNNCNNEFIEYIASNSELVCFEDKDGEKYFMPSYGKYGYLDLLKRLVVDWNYGDRITKSVTEKFEIKLKKFTPYDVVLFQRVKCPKCKMMDVYINKRNTLLNHPVKWMKINTDQCETESF